MGKAAIGRYSVMSISEAKYQYFVKKMTDDGCNKAELLEQMVLEYAVVPPSDNKWSDTPFYLVMMKKHAPEPLCRLYCETKWPTCDAEKIGTTSDGRSYYALKVKKGYSVH